MKAILYARFSPRPSAKECESCERQFEDMEAFCAKHGWEIVDRFHDKAVSGADQYEVTAHRKDGQAELTVAFEEREGLGEAFDALKSGYILLVRAQDRLSRDPKM